MSVSPEFTCLTRTRGWLVALFCASLVAACASDPGPLGGSKPGLTEVPTAPTPRYDAFERAVLADSLTATAGRTRDVAAAADARVAGAPPPQAAAPAAVAVTPVADVGPRRASRGVDLDDTLATADDVLGLARAVLRDREELERRRRVLAAAAAPEVAQLERVTAIAFAPGSSVVASLERDRLQQAVVRAGRDGTWLVRAGGPLGEARAQAVLTSLVANGVEAEAVRTAATDRDVDLAEVVVRR